MVWVKQKNGWNKLLMEEKYKELYELIKEIRITNPKAIKLIELSEQLKSTIE